MEHLNQYHVLFLDIASFISITEDIGETVAQLQADVIEELQKAFPGCIRENVKSLFKAFEGLKDAIVDMLGGQRCKIDTGTFQNDMTSLQSRDDVLTLLVHLGYLAHDNGTKEVSIPNEEVREEFIRAVKNGTRAELLKAIHLSEKLLDATLQMEEDVVADLLEEAHQANTGLHIITMSRHFALLLSRSKTKITSVLQKNSVIKVIKVNFCL